MICRTCRFPLNAADAQPTRSASVVSIRCPRCGRSTTFPAAEAHARRSDPPTSHEAAASVIVGHGQEIVLDAFRRHGKPLTDELLVQLVDGQISSSGARTRRSELVDAGLIRDSGQRVTLASRRKAIAWELVP